MIEQFSRINGFSRINDSFISFSCKAFCCLALIALMPICANATTITKYQNWENLEFLPGQTFRNYSPAEFNNAISDWYVNSSNRDGYGVEHQHSQITWGQSGTNDDFLELDLQFTEDSPQIYTGFSTADGQGLGLISIDFELAGRPDLDESKNLSLYGRFDGGEWQTFDSYSILSGNSLYPDFTNYTFSLALDHLFSGIFEFGFACTDCANTPGYGILLGDVTANYTVQDLPSSEVPEPGTLLLLSAALTGVAKRKRKRARA